MKFKLKNILANSTDENIKKLSNVIDDTLAIDYQTLRQQYAFYEVLKYLEFSDFSDEKLTIAAVSYVHSIMANECCYGLRPRRSEDRDAWLNFWDSLKRWAARRPVKYDELMAMHAFDASMCDYRDEHFGPVAALLVDIARNRTVGEEARKNVCEVIRYVWKKAYHDHCFNTETKLLEILMGH